MPLRGGQAKRVGQVSGYIFGAHTDFRPLGHAAGLIIREQGLGAWSDAEIRRAIAQGVGRDGRKLEAPMPYAWYAGIRADDLDAIVAYLRTLPPLPR